MRLDNDSKTLEQRRALLNTVTKIDSMIQQRYKTSADEKSDAAVIYNRIVKMNGGAYIRGKFILVYKEVDFALGEDSKASNINAIVLDEATLRFFPALYVYKEEYEYPPYLYYGDYDNLKIEQNGLTINGNSSEAKTLTLWGQTKVSKSR